MPSFAAFGPFAKLLTTRPSSFPHRIDPAASGMRRRGTMLIGILPERMAPPLRNASTVVSRH